jgi:hypothetical protein
MANLSPNLNVKRRIRESETESKVQFMLFHQNIRSVNGKIEELLIVGQINIRMFYVLLNIIYASRKLVSYIAVLIQWQQTIVGVNSSLEEYVYMCIICYHLQPST